jgi:hypothetical protein
MLRSLFASFAVASLAFASVACSGAAGSPADDSTAGSAAVTSESSASAATSAPRFYFATAAGDFVTVNEQTTACASGTRAASCEINQFDFSALGLGADDAASLEAQVRAGTAIVQGTLAQIQVPVGGGSRAIEIQAQLTVTAAWASPAAAVSTGTWGNFQMVTKNVANCGSINQSNGGSVNCNPYELVMVNKNTDASAPAIDLTGAGASSAAVTNATSALQDGGLLTFGYFEGTAKGPKTYEITAFFLPVTASN